MSRDTRLSKPITRVIQRSRLAVLAARPRVVELAADWTSTTSPISWTRYSEAITSTCVQTSAVSCLWISLNETRSLCFLESKSAPSLHASHSSVFTARRYASAVLAVIVCPSVRPSVCLSVRPSVTSRSCTKMAKPRIRLTTPYDSPETLVFRCRKS